MMWQVNLSPTPHIMNVLSLFLSGFMYEMLNFPCSELFAIPIHDGSSSRFKWIQYSAFKNCLKLQQLKGTVEIFKNNS
jgi:hypothetical protein